MTSQSSTKHSSCAQLKRHWDALQKDRYCPTSTLFQGRSLPPKYFKKWVDDKLSGIEKFKCLTDNILVIWKDHVKHEQRLKQGLDRLGECGLTLNLEKCLFYQTRFPYLAKPLALKDSVNISKRLEPSFAGYVRPEMEGAWLWDPDQQEAFQRLKAVIGTSSCTVRYGKGGHGVVRCQQFSNRCSP